MRPAASTRGPAAEDGPLVVAIDGPAGVGKSTVARAVADALGWRWLDTGALYRVVTLAVLEAALDPTDVEEIVRVAQGLDVRLERDGRVLWGDRDVTDRIRAPDVGRSVASVAALAALRRVLVAVQRQVAREAGRLVAEGRDMGTVVFPDAFVKVFLDAEPGERARRRTRQAGGGPSQAAVAAVQADLEARDAQDRSRAASPLEPADDAWRLDTTEMTQAQVVEAVLSHVRSRIRSVEVSRDDRDGVSGTSSDRSRDRAGPDAVQRGNAPPSQA